MDETGAMNLAFWKGRRVFVTGQTGFKGAWLTLWLQQLDARVTGYALDPPTDPSLFALADVGSGIDDLRGDVRDATALEHAMRQARPEIVIHLAAQPLVRASYESPVDTYSTNVMGTVHLLEAARKTSDVRAVVVVTSDKCYENREWDRGYREDDAMGGFDPYSSSKGCAELVTSAYRRSFSMPIASARAGNVIGGGDWGRDRLLPDLFRAFVDGRPATIRNPVATRPWQHVMDPLRGYLLLAEKLWNGEAAVADAWNFGPLKSDVRPVAWVADAVVRRWGGSASWTMDAAVHVHEARILALDISKAGTRLGWHPALGVEDALEWTVRWHKRLQTGASARELTIHDICEYGERVAAANPETR